MNIPINSLDELVYLLVFVVFLNLASAFLIFKRTSYKPLINRVATFVVCITGLIAVVTSISIFYAKNSEFDNSVESLQLLVNNLNLNLDACLDFAEELNEYELQTAIRHHFEGFRVAVLGGNVFVLLVTGFLTYMYTESENSDYFWLILIGVVVSSFMGGIAIGTIDVFTHTQSLLKSYSLVASKFRADCIDPGFTKIFDTLDPNEVEYCNSLIKTNSCAIKDKIEDIINFNIDEYKAVTWAAAVIPTLCFNIVCTCLLFFKQPKQPYTAVSKYELTEFTESSF